MTRRRGTAGGAILLVVVTAASSGATTTPPVRPAWEGLLEEGRSRAAVVEGALGPEHAARVRDADARVRELRASLEHGSTQDRVAAIVTADSSDAPATPPLPALARADLAIVGHAPPELRAPLAGLVAAVRRARRITETIDVRELESVLRSAVRRFPVRIPQLTRTGTKWVTAPERGYVSAQSGDTEALLARLGAGIRSWSVRTGTDASAPPGFSSEWMTRMTRLLEESRAASRRAALLLAAAADRYVPELDAWTGDAAGRPAEGCDVVDQTPFLCVGSDADNTYKADVALSIDLGGEDVYKTDVATTYLETDPASAVDRIGLHLDLGSGGDVYRPQHGTGVAVAPVGAALVLDGGGDDEYVTQMPDPKRHAPGDRAVSMGCSQGCASLGSVAVLVDAGGEDEYLVLGTDGTDDYVTFGGQANVALGGAAGLVDAGSEADRYVLDAGRGTEDLGNDATAERAVGGQASAAWAGGAVLFDGGGESTFAMRAEVRYADRSLVDTPTGVFPSPATAVNGQALSDLGSSTFLLTGEGDTTYEMSMPTSGWRVWRISAGQARSSSTFVAEGVAVIDDRAGDDSYSMTTSNDYSPEVVVDESCNCTTAEIILEGIESVPNPNPYLFGQAVGGLSSNALIRDHAGDDAYRLTSANRWKASLFDRLDRASLRPALRFFGLSFPLVVAQGWGQGPAVLFSQPVAGSGVLLDEAGTDSYVAGSKFEVTARALSKNGKPDVRLVYGYGATGLQDGMFGMNGETVMAQGASASGYLVDLGGAGDEMHAFSDISLGTVPAGGDYHQAAFWPSIQGGQALGGGLVALGEDPVITATPSTPVFSESPGVHGFGLWTGCCTDGDDAGRQRVDYGSGYGYAPLAAGEVPSLELVGVADSAVTDPRGFERLPVAARLTGPDGEPLAGHDVHFNLQWAQLVAAGTTSPWQNVYQSDATTTKKGLARTTLPLWMHVQSGDDLVPDGNVFFRVLATFDGTGDLQPRHAAQGLSLDVAEEEARARDWLRAARAGTVLR